MVFPKIQVNQPPRDNSRVVAYRSGNSFQGKRGEAKPGAEESGLLHYTLLFPSIGSQNASRRLRIPDMGSVLLDRVECMLRQ